MGCGQRGGARFLGVTMHPLELEAKERARQMIAICRKGFRNEFHWKQWFAKHRMDINAMPAALRKAVLLAHDQATHEHFSK